MTDLLFANDARFLIWIKTSAPKFQPRSSWWKIRVEKSAKSLICEEIFIDKHRKDLNLKIYLSFYFLLEYKSNSQSFLWDNENFFPSQDLRRNIFRIA